MDFGRQRIYTVGEFITVTRPAGLIRRRPMFDSLEEQMKADESKATSPRERAMKWIIGAVVVVVVFGGLYVGVHMLNGS
jgi:hypothetical protein